MCRVCGEAIPADRAVQCGRCETPHHRDCWDYVGHCAIFACSCVLTRVAPPAAARPALPGKSAFLEVGADGRAIVEGRRVQPAPTGPVRDVDGVERDFGARHVDLELDTVLERALQWTALGLFLAGVVLGFPRHRPPDWVIPGILWPAALGVMVLRLLVDCRYILDNQRRVLVYRRSIPGLAMCWRICRFDQLSEVVVVSHSSATKQGPSYTFSVALRLPSGDLIEVSRDTSERRVADGFCRNLAEHLRIDRDVSVHHPPGMELTLPAEATPEEPDVVEAARDPLEGIAWPWRIFFALLLLANGMLFF